MTDYLDVSVVQIQSWLTRTPQLQGRRGASTMISAATAREVIDKLLVPHSDLVKRNDEVGDVDGVVALQLLTPEPDAAKQVKNAVVAHLRAKLPTASLVVRKTSGKNYADAQLNTSEPDDEHWPAAVADWPVGRPCEWCHVQPADPIQQDREQKRLCRECVMRREAAGWAKSGTRVPSQEEKLLTRLALPPGKKVPDEFKDLAALEEERSLALVYADGNAVGRFISGLQRGTKKGRKLLPTIAKEIDEATWTALVKAVEAISDADDHLLPVVPHLVGGDDVLVSVPARRAWRFVMTLQSTFAERIAAQASGAGAQLPTLSAGIVFHHYARPLHVMCDLAKTLLRRAKESVQGNEAAIAWQDVTRDGQTPADRDPVRLADLLAKHADLTRLAERGNSAQQRLAELIRVNGVESEPLQTHLQRLGLGEVVSPFRDRPIELLDALGMVRWWR
ncbi:hypothetical protein MOQ72_02035 [Saccharopolyspora sp. K220]|uniref:Cas10/Cmr2 second palm domain-containing protein n=1 Tax=Saccharopolyspora soli TaxID=2926618 RepID=UPI001F5AB564|nr:hypothetical protein [Saccharopolyspora soli]MCI2416190.1 hypothetical protein [Saccharopolyspora soli]